jgi:hypothetical protein
LGLVLVIGFVAVSLLAPGGRHQWALAIVRQPTRYTVLSFQDAADLPDQLGAGGNVDLSFAVTNDEGRPLRYEYVVTSASGPQDAVVLLRATTAIPAGGRRSVALSVHPVCSASPCTVAIALPGHPEIIDALINIPTPQR